MPNLILKESSPLSLSYDQHIKAVNESAYSTLDQLKSSLNQSAIGFYLACIGTWLVMTLFIGQFFAGDEVERFGEWSAMQVIYFCGGAVIASAIAGTLYHLFSHGKTKEFWVTAAFATSFIIAAETGSALQRESVRVANKSQQSPVFQATLKAANALSENINTLSPTQQELINARDDYNYAKSINASRETLERHENRVKQLEHKASIESQNKQNILSSTLQSARQLEYDVTKHQASIILISELAGISHVKASGLLAFITMFISALATHYLGYQMFIARRAVDIKQGNLPIDIEVLTESNKNKSLRDYTATHVQQNSVINMAKIQDQPACLEPPNDALYSQFIQDLLKGDLSKFTIDPMKLWVKEHLSPELLPIINIQEETYRLLNKAVKDGYLKENDEYREGNRKPRYIINNY